MVVPRPMTLQQCLSGVNLPGNLRLPWVHSTSASNLMDIIADGKTLSHTVQRPPLPPITRALGMGHSADT
jgi:hypothetical protein